jgi:tagatose-6-phosphate ketose/aldose isomerase
LLVGFLSTVRAERSYELELIEEVRRKSLARAVALVAPEPDARANELADLYIELELGVPAPLRPLLDVVVGQVLALFSSLAHGLPPDSPSPNGAIQRVVTHIRPADGGAEVNAR